MNVRPRIPRKARQVAVGFLAWLCLGLASPTEDELPYVAQLGEILRAPRQDAPLQIARLGPDAAPAAWSILSGRVLKGTKLDKRAAKLLLQDGLSRSNGDATAARLLEVIGSDATLTERLVMVEMLGWTGSDTALRGVFEVLGGVPEVQLGSRRIESALGRGLPPLLLDDARRFGALASHLPQIPRPLLPVLVEVMADIDRPEASSVLARIAAVEPAEAQRVLGVIARRPRPLAPATVHECVVITRDHLSSSNPLHRRLAATAVGRLMDAPSFARLTVLLEDDDAVVRREALESLQAMSHIQRDWHAEAWMEWFGQEQAWLKNAAALTDDLAGDAHRAGVAIRTLCAHPLFGEEVAELLFEGLDHADPHVRARTCEGLRRLGHPAAIPNLIDALDDVEQEVHAAARTALVTLTTVDHGEDPDSWRDWWRTLQ